VAALAELEVDLLAGGLGVATRDDRTGPTNSVFLPRQRGHRLDLEEDVPRLGRT
jgi:hypothetical protein